MPSGAVPTPKKRNASNPVPSGFGIPHRGVDAFRHHFDLVVVLRRKDLRW
jgi:hypothetical protein